MRIVLCFFLTFSTLTSGVFAKEMFHGKISAEISSENPKTFLEKFPSFYSSFKEADEVLIYKGLPAFFTLEDMKERESQPKVNLNGYDFYASPKKLTDEEIKILNEMYSSDSFLLYGEVSRCMFHPDYAIEWRDKNGILRTLFCFTCHEMKSSGPNGELISGINYNFFNKLEKTIESLWTKNSKEEESRL